MRVFTSKATLAALAVLLAGCGGSGTTRNNDDVDNAVTQVRFGGVTGYNGNPVALTGTPTGGLNVHDTTVDLTLGDRHLILTIDAVDLHKGQRYLISEGLTAAYTQSFDVGGDGVWTATNGALEVVSIKDGKAILRLENVVFSPAGGSNPARGSFNLSGLIADFPVKVYTESTDLTFSSAVGANATLTSFPTDSELYLTYTSTVVGISAAANDPKGRTLGVTFTGSPTIGDTLDIATTSGLDVRYAEGNGVQTRTWKATAGTVKFTALANNEVRVEIANAKMEPLVATGNPATGTFFANGSISKR